MFGRRRRRDDENVGLAGLGTGDASQAFASPPTVSVTAGPAPASDSASAAAPPPAEMSATSDPGTPTIPFPGLAPGTMPTNPAAMLGQILSGQGPVGELVAEIRADPEAFRQRMIAQAQASGMPNTPQWSVSGGAALQKSQADVIAELTKAADLHHQGALTDDEFAALKKKLLDG